MARIAWHTDIVVDGQGMNVKVTRPRTGCAKIALMPDVPGRKSQKAKKRFMKKIESVPSCSTAQAKRAVQSAVRKTKARWNKWHHETY